MRLLQLCCACQGFSGAFLSYVGRRNSRGKGEEKKKENWKNDRDWGERLREKKKKKEILMVGKTEKELKGNWKEKRRWGRSAAAPSCDKCHQPSLTPDKGSVHQRCQLWRPAGSTVTFSPVHSERSSSIFPYFTTPSAERLPFYSAQPFCSPRCFLAPIAQKRSQAAEIESSDPASQGEAVWAWIQPKAPKHQIDGSAAVSLNIPWIHPWEHWEVSSSTVLLQKTVTSFENANWL